MRRVVTLSSVQSLLTTTSLQLLLLPMVQFPLLKRTLPPSLLFLVAQRVSLDIFLLVLEEPSIARWLSHLQLAFFSLVLCRLSSV